MNSPRWRARLLACGRLLAYERLTSEQRVKALVVGLALGAIVALGFFLTPDPRGYGTHEQLGLPPCWTHFLFGIPCPLCGMTTAYSLMAHGRVSAAFNVQPGGAIFFVATSMGSLGALLIALIGVRPRWMAAPLLHRLLYAAALVVIFVAWAVKIFQTIVRQ